MVPIYMGFNVLTVSPEMYDDNFKCVILENTLKVKTLHIFSDIALMKNERTSLMISQCKFK